MVEYTNWKDGARADLLARLQDARERVEHWYEMEAEAGRNMAAAEKDEEDILAAAETLGIDLGAPVRQPAPASSRAAVPTAREIILGALIDRQPRGMKAAELRKVIEEKMGRAIHYKTPGMTLYRLAEEGMVRREGHTWFASDSASLLHDPQLEAPME